MGQFKANEPKGNGRIIFEDGTEFNGLFNGFSRRKGTLTLVNGDSIPIDTDDLFSEGSIDNKSKDA